jgi:hypothetical protein
MRSKLFFGIFVYSVALTLSGCSVSPTIIKAQTSAELSNFLNKTNLVYNNDFYWTKSLPSAPLGVVYKKQTKTIEGKTYEAFSFVTNSIFNTSISDSNLTPEDGHFSKEYTYSRSDDAQLTVAAYFAGSYDDVHQIKQKVEITKATVLASPPDSVKTAYCTDDYWFVSKVYKGADSYFGLSKVMYKVGILGNIGSYTAAGETSLHELRDGVIALSLEPTNHLSGCGATSPRKIIPLMDEIKIWNTNAKPNP